MRKIVLDFGWGHQYLFENDADALLVIEKLGQTIQFKNSPKDDSALEIDPTTTVKTYTIDAQMVQDAMNFKLLEGK